MPITLEQHTDETCTLEEAFEALSNLQFDPREGECLQVASSWLRKLSNNRHFLADRLVERITGRAEGSIDSGYGPQAIVLSPLKGNVFLRANIWPSEHDLCFKNSGAANFVYGLPHDHNFSFLTSGYLGPGYRSDYFEYDYDNVCGYAGEHAGLRFVERSALSEGKMMLYRAHLDVHSQLPPESLSVSLNVMHVDPAQCWYDQYGFDLESGHVSRVLSPNATEVFMRAAIGLGTQEALDYAEWVGKSHPSERLRLASFEARAARLSDCGEQDRHWRSAELAGSSMVAAIASERRRALEI